MKRATSLICLAGALALVSCGRQPSAAPSVAPRDASATPGTSPAVPPGAPGAPGVTAKTAEGDPIAAAFVSLPARLEDGLCERALIAVTGGKVTAMGEVLEAGDTMVVVHREPMELQGTGLAVVVTFRVPVCNVKARPAPEKTVLRAGAAPPLHWANGTMEAHLDVGATVSPEVYLGRLSGTAPVSTHTHDASWEILAAVEASGTFTLDGKEQRLGPRQVVLVPPRTTHAWKPDPGSRLVAVQMYSPPGPEQRFVALAQKEAAPASSPR
jgi:mannose-6-phosphate isomerase-like protein (cupin superfamily)